MIYFTLKVYFKERLVRPDHEVASIWQWKYKLLKGKAPSRAHVSTESNAPEVPELHSAWRYNRVTLFRET
jgi:hypothetical protein